MYALITSLLVAAVCVFFIEALHPCRPHLIQRFFFPPSEGTQLLYLLTLSWSQSNEEPDSVLPFPPMSKWRGEPGL